MIKLCTNFLSLPGWLTHDLLPVLSRGQNDRQGSPSRLTRCRPLAPCKAVPTIREAFLTFLTFSVPGSKCLNTGNLDLRQGQDPGSGQWAVGCGQQGMLGIVLIQGRTE